MTSSFTASCTGPSASFRVQGVRTCSMGSTAPRGMWVNALRSISSQIADRTSGSLVARTRREHLSLLSTAGNSYDADYFGDTSQFSKGMRTQHRVPDGQNWDETIFNVFKKKNGAIRHFWGSEMSFAPTAPKQHHRAGDLSPRPGWRRAGDLTGPADASYPPPPGAFDHC